MLEDARNLQEEMVAIRRHVHANPELSFKEFKTAEFAAEKLRGYGYSVKEGVSGTGVIADLGSGKTIAIRSEMDALPINELNRIMYASKTANVMHACGHDAHLACVLGAAKLLSQQTCDGRVRIILQPGEEAKDSAGKSGAFRMIENGALTGVDAILGLHVDSTLPANKVGVVAGAIAPGAQEFLIVVHEGEVDGPSLSDTAFRTSKLLQSLYELTPKLVTLSEPILLSIGSIRSAGDDPRAAAGDVTIQGSFRTFADEMRAMVKSEIEKICSLTASATISFPASLTTVLEGEQLTAIVLDLAQELIGATNVLSIKRRAWAADYSLYTERIPGAFIYLGGEISSNRRIHHSPSFDIDESGLYIGAAILAATALRWIG